MGWYLVRVHDLDGGEEGCAIFCSVTGSFVRPMVDHPRASLTRRSPNGSPLTWWTPTATRARASTPSTPRRCARSLRALRAGIK